MQPVSTSSTADAAPPDPARPVFIGIDWADQAHAICLIDPQRPTPQHGSLDQKPEAIAAWAKALQQKYAGRELCLIIETSKGALISAPIAIATNPQLTSKTKAASPPSPSKAASPKSSTRDTPAPSFTSKTFHEFVDQARRWCPHKYDGGQSLLRRQKSLRHATSSRRPRPRLQMDPHPLPNVETPKNRLRHPRHPSPHQSPQPSRQSPGGLQKCDLKKPQRSSGYSGHRSTGVLAGL